MAVLEKVLRSAVANAESRPGLHWEGDELVVAAAYADEGPTLKRWRARARGRVARIRKRTCHITVRLQEVPAPPAPQQPPPKAEEAATTKPKSAKRSPAKKSQTSSRSKKAEAKA